MARSAFYIGFRSAQFILALTVIGIAGFLFSDFKKHSYSPGLTDSNSGGDLFDVGEVLAADSSSSSSLSTLGSDVSSTLLFDAFGSATRAISGYNGGRTLYRRSPKGGGRRSGKKGSSGGRSGSSSSNYSTSSFGGSSTSPYGGLTSSSTIKYSMPLAILIVVSVVTLLTAIVSSVLNYWWPSWAIYVFWFFVPWDIVLAIFWIAAAGVTARFLTQYSGWKADFMQAHLFKTCFALAAIVLISFIVTAVFTCMVCWRSRKNKKAAGPAVENAAVAAAAEAPLSYGPEKGPPIYSNETAPAPQAYYDPQQQPYQPPVSPPPQGIYTPHQPAPFMQPGYQYPQQQQ